MKFFKIGDKVVLNTDSAKWSVQVEEGTKGTVERIHGDGALDVLFKPKENGGTLRQTVDPEDLDSLEPMKFKVGDKVKYIGILRQDLERIVGTVLEAYSDFRDYPYLVDFGIGFLWCAENELASAEKLSTKARKKTLKAISAEVQRARVKFPDNSHLCHALMEEAGEVVKAYLEGEPIENIRNEACQVAAVAVRIIEEGDQDFD